MSADDEAGRRLGAALVDWGWVQGAWFAPPSAAVYVNQFGDASGTPPPPGERALKARERLIVVTQTCDIVSPDEPYVEALVCQRERNRDYLARLDRNSARQFVIDPAGGWVARAAYRVLIDKAYLAGAYGQGGSTAGSAAVPWRGGRISEGARLSLTGRGTQSRAAPSTSTPRLSGGEAWGRILAPCQSFS
jgi:hypothetical protein